MGKQMRRNSSNISIPQDHPRCMWGILHVLKYHHWHWRFIKKRLPYKKNDAGAENPVDEVQASNSDNSSKYKKAEVANSKVEGKKRLSSPATKSSVKSRLKALITDEMSKRKGRGRHHRSSTYPARSQLTQTGSIHQAEAHIDDLLPEIALIDGSPRVADKNKEIFSDSSCKDQVIDESGIDESEKQVIESAIFCQQDFLKQKSITSKEVTKDDSAYESKYLMDALDIIKMNKGFLLTILQDPDSPLAQHFHKQLAINAKMGITKSETFPPPGSSSRRDSEPCRQKQKQDETDVCFHGQNSPDHESIEAMSQLNQAKAEMAEMSSSGSSHNLNQSGGNEVAKQRFRNLKQNIKHAIKERKNERHRIAMDAVLHKIPHKEGFSKDLTKDIVDHFKDPSRIRKLFSEFSTSKRGMQQERRASSFNESMDRYTQLYESSFNREAKEHISKRKQERKEAPKSMGRILSSPELYSSFYLSEDSDAFSYVSEALDYSSQLDTLEKSESEENLIGIRGTFSVSSDQLASKSSINSKTIAQVQKTSDESGNFEIVPITKLEEPSSISLLNFNSEGQTASPAEISKLQAEMNDSWLEPDLELKQSYYLPNELDFLADPQHEFRVDRNDKHEFTYVRDVLELSGFSGNEMLGTWHADDQPLDPLMYEEIRGCILCDPNCSMDEEEEVDYCNHPLLFDLINEVLMDLYERSYSNCPRVLSSLCHIRPMPVGHHVLEQVWENISWFLSFKTGYDKPLDYVASRDLTRSDGWMNLQFENECMGLELEELIFDDLLEELIWT